MCSGVGSCCGHIVLVATVRRIATDRRRRCLPRLSNPRVVRVPRRTSAARAVAGRSAPDTFVVATRPHPTNRPTRCVKAAVQRPFCARQVLGTGGVTYALNTDGMGTTDEELDATSRRLLNEIDDLKRLEREKRQTARSSDEFHDLAAKVEGAARHVFDSASAELIDARDDSPLQDERDEQHPGDWTEASRN